MVNKNPTQKQIYNSSLSGWEYLGDGIFVKEDSMGWFKEEGGWEVV